jgi:hypothetical protein
MTSDFEKIRDHALESAPEKGVEIAEKSNTMTGFAAETADLGLDVREDLQSIATTKTERDAARFMDYEVREAAREPVLRNPDIEQNEYDLRADMVRADNVLEQFYRTFILMDRLRRGYTDVRPDEKGFGLQELEPQLFPDPADPESLNRDSRAALQETGSVDMEGVGNLYMNGVYVVNDDWISYRSGKQPETIENDVMQYLEELGVGR